MISQERLAMIEVTYPSFVIWIGADRPGGVCFWARRRTPPTTHQHQAGVRLYIGRTTLDRLSEALSHQTEIAWRIRI